MKVKNFLRTKWQYLFVFALPWVFVLIHSMIRGSWLTGEGSILYKDAGNLYVQLYSELWDKVHNGGSLTFSWSAGLGVDFAVNILRYLISPFTLIMLVVPRSMIATMVQVFMVLKWSLLSVSMLYYVSHTKHNTIGNRRTILCVTIAMVYFLSNAAIAVLHNLSCLDVMIAFPMLLLLVEKMPAGKGFKRFYVLFALTILMNYQIAVPVAIFLLIWFIMQFDKETPCSKCSVISFIVAYAAAIITGMMAIIPNLALGLDAVGSGPDVALSFGEMIQRFFVVDTLLVAQANQPMLYCSIVALILALLFVFTNVSLKNKIGTCVLTLLLGVGMLSEMGNSVWNGTLRTSGEFAFLFVFVIAYMAMETIAHLESTKMWQIITVGIVGIAGCVYGFFSATILLEFYVYLATILVVVFVFMMLIFYRKKSIQYQNVLIVLAVICVIELATNAVYQLKVYNEYTLEDTYYHKDAENLTGNLSLEAGERVAMVQGTYNYGMKMQTPNASWGHAISNIDMSELYQLLGLEWSEEGAAYFGGSPLLNTMFNIRYGLGQNEMPFSDCEKIKSSQDGYSLYKMNRLAGLGYMVACAVTDWNLDETSPFAIQNDFVAKSTGNDAIFEVLTPDISCQSLMGLDPDAEHGHEHVHQEESAESAQEEDLHTDTEHSHSHASTTDFYRGEYVDDIFYYHFQKVYSDDVVNMSFRSDGVSDYYIFMRGADKSLTYVQIKGEYVYWDQFASNQKMIHIGVVPEGTIISVISNVEIDGMDDSEICYQVAAYNETEYAAVYDTLSANTWQLETFEDGYVKGSITADFDGIMMTGIPAYEGMSVTVDGKESTYKKIGNAMIGVPLSAGTHEVIVEYKNPYLMDGVFASMVGVVIFLVFCMIQAGVRKKTEIKE